MGQRAAGQGTGRARGSLQISPGGERGWHLGLSARGVETKQVACGRDLGLNPGEQSRAGSHFLGLQVLGALQPWEGRWEETAG